MKNLIKAVNAVMLEVSNIEKNSNVGVGKSAYKGVKDIDVKKAFNKAFVKEGLAIFPISVEPIITTERWVENTSYGEKQKQQIFTEVKTKYLLCHESGESIELQGYGHGIDSQDKSAGKATTYALKYALLYTFLTPVGDIDDADTTHSDNYQIKKENTVVWMTEKQFQTACESDKETMKKYFDGFSNLEKDGKTYKMKKEYSEKLKELLTN